MARFYRDVAGPYWPPERSHVESRYESIPFPFDEIPVPEFSMELEWRLDDLLGYIESWSAVQRCIKERGQSPMPQLESELQEIWGDPDAPKTIRWPLTVKAGRKR